jgi:hypothetical protein
MHNSIPYQNDPSAVDEAWQEQGYSDGLVEVMN